MPSKLSNLFDNLSGIFNKESEKCRKRKKIRVESKFVGFRNNRLNYRCKECNELCAKSPNEAIKNFPNLRKFCNGDLNKFFLLLRKGVYPYEYMDNWKKFDETSIPLKEPFYSKLNEEGISDADYERVKKVWEVFEIKTLVSIMVCMFNAIHYCCLQMCLKTLKICILKYISLIQFIFCQHQD